MNPLELERAYRNARHTLSLLTGPRNRLAALLDVLDQLSSPAHRASLPAYATELVPLLQRTIAAADFSSAPPLLAERARRALDLLDPYTRASDDTALRSAAERALAPGPPAVVPADVIRIPMVEEEYLLPGFTPRYAAIAGLRVDLRRRIGAPDDEIHISRASPGDQSAPAFTDALSAARSLLLHSRNLRIPVPLTVYCTVEGSAAVHGASLGTGLGVALVCALLRFAGHREEFRPRPDAAFTGILDAAGRILPVAEAGLLLKVEACHHAGLRYAVLPAVQLAAAEAHLRTCAAGGGSLTLIGVRTLEDVFHDRRLISSRLAPAAVQAARRLWKYRRPLAAGLLLLLAGSLARVLLGPPDRVPADVVFAGSLMTVVNRGGEELQSIEVGRTTVNNTAPDINQGAALLDVDGDGTTELLWTQVSDNGDEPGGTVHCRTVGEHRDLWSIPVRKKVDFPLNRVDGEDFGTFGIIAGDFDRDGAPEAAVIARHALFPSLILLLDARDGRERGCYLHAGHITRMLPVDLEPDGRVEILLTGVNNAMGEAFLAVLDPSCPGGHGPVEGRYAPEGVPAARERAYVLIPKSIVHEAHPGRVRWNIGAGLTYTPSSRTIRVAVREGVHDENPDHDDVSYYLVFSAGLDPLMVETGDNFDILAERYRREGRITRAADMTYWSEYIRRIRFWTGSSWGPSPAFRSCDHPASPGK